MGASWPLMGRKAAASGYMNTANSGYCKSHREALVSRIGNVIAMGNQRTVRKLKNATGFIVVALGLFASSMAARAQRTKSFAEPESAPTIASVMEVQLRIVESQVVPAAEAMPEDKYSFAPTSGEYKQVRTFALQLK